MSSALLASALLVTGCATKKHVKTSIEPLERRVDELEAKTKKTDSSVAELERNLSKTDEQVRGADARANQAALEAAKANERAARSSEQAEAAGRAASSAQSAIDAEKKRIAAIDERITNLDNYQVEHSESVLFKFGSHTLSADSKKQLDAAAGKILDEHRYVVEVQGYTDKTGSAEYNLMLSRKRADAVVQYLTVQHKVPLHRLFVNGVGSEMPAADNKSRQGREQNRRVEVRLYTPKAN
ncbi:MAG: hypothetical protein FJW20_16800 [Acidimicrobiia bacterium]|nr:hypothetical protein [Acidimicrobiia bacterium]